VVLKPADSVQARQWFAEVYDALAGPGFRVPRPVALPVQLIHADLAGLVYRLVTEIVRHSGTAGVDAAARAAQPVTDLVLARLSGRRLRLAARHR
jgi:hypothetical protein